jgi:hypothetical protein
VFAAFVAVLILIQFVGPARTNPPSDPEKAMAKHVAVPADVQSILDRSCQNCHSNKTVWPSYSHVAPVSWNVIWHVNDGRDSMNMSDWPSGPEEAADLLDGICKEVKKGKMPMPQYTWMHGEAKLTDADRTRLCQWADKAAGDLY